MKKKQKLVPVHVTITPGPGEPAIVPVGGESLDELLDAWRIVAIQPLGQKGEETTFVALLLLEEAQSEASLGRLGFRHE